MFYTQGRNQRAVWKYLRQTSTLCRVFLVLGEVSPCFGNICYEAAQALPSNRWSVWSGNSEPRCCRCASMIWRQQKVWIALISGSWRLAVAVHPLLLYEITPLPQMHDRMKTKWVFQRPPSLYGNVDEWLMQSRWCVLRSRELTKASGYWRCQC